jgi:ABC-type lipoprotein export system ATPase subunit
MITRATRTAALVVTHNQQLALNMDSILTISDGTIISIG